jgi:ribosomal protein S14
VYTGLLLGLVLMSAAAADVSWVPGHTRPADLVDAASGRGGPPSLVCRAPFRGGVHPGKLVGDQCNIGWGGKEESVRNFELLRGSTLWGSPQPGYAGAVVGGQSDGTPMPVCRAEFRGGWHAGKVVADQCNFGWGGKEESQRSFDVLYPLTQAAPQPPSAGVWPPPLPQPQPPGVPSAPNVPPSWPPAARPPLPGGQAGLNWTPAFGGALPNDAVIAGLADGQPLAVCRAPFRGGVHPGKVVAGHCNIGWGGKEESVRPYEVLHGAAQWGPPRAGYAGAVVGGQSDGTPLPVCRANFRGATHPGKVVGNQCNIGWGGKEEAVRRFEVLYPAGGAVAQPPSVDAGAAGQGAVILLAGGQATQPLGGQVLWLAAEAGKLPAGAVVGGYDGARPMQVCRVSYRGGVHPGKVVAGRCNIGYGGREMVLAPFEVLSGGVQWGPPRPGDMGAIVGGWQQDDAGGLRYLAVCRAEFRGAVHPGKAIDGACNIGWGGREERAAPYEVLYPVQ